MKTTYPTSPVQSFKEWLTYIKRERSNLSMKIDGIIPPIEVGSEIRIDGVKWKVISYHDQKVLLKNGDAYLKLRCSIDGKILQSC